MILNTKKSNITMRLYWPVILKAMPFLMTFSFGFLVGAFLNPFVHEIGHYTFAYVFNKSAISEFSYSPQNVIGELIGTYKGNTPHYVSYTGPLYEVFKPYQAVLVSLAGLLFQLILFILVLSGLNKYYKYYVIRAYPKDLLVYFFLLGILISCLSITWSWIGDGAKFFYVFIQEKTKMKIGIYAIVLALVFIWTSSAIKSFRSLYKLLKIWVNTSISK